jgi:hypothetical protein
MFKLKKFVNNALEEMFGYTISKSYDLDLDRRLSALEASIIKRVRDRTMTNANSIVNLISATNYISKFGVEGAFVECGVWRGGSAMAFCLASMNLGMNDRDVYLMDTFEGFTNVSERDYQLSDRRSAKELFDVDPNYICSASLEDVKIGIAETQYPSERVHYLVGDIVETSPNCLPKEIAVLRLDTDYYESTLWELKHLFPRVSKNGIIIIDDYDHWSGAREACDEYFSSNDQNIFMMHMEYGRLIFKNG